MLTPGALLNLVEDICTECAVDNNVAAEVVEECILGWKSDIATLLCLHIPEYF